MQSECGLALAVLKCSPTRRAEVESAKPPRTLAHLICIFIKRIYQLHISTASHKMKTFCSFLPLGFHQFYLSKLKVWQEMNENEMNAAIVLIFTNYLSQQRQSEMCYARFEVNLRYNYNYKSSFHIVKNSHIFAKQCASFFSSILCSSHGFTYHKTL